MATVFYTVVNRRLTTKPLLHIWHKFLILRRALLSSVAHKETEVWTLCEQQKDVAIRHVRHASRGVRDPENIGRILCRHSSPPYLIGSVPICQVASFSPAVY